MAILQTGNSYSDGDQVTSTNLNAAVNAATFQSGAVDGATTQLSASGQVMVKDKGITAAKLETAANGQLFIGNGSGFDLGSLTAGDGISLLFSENNIQITSTGSIGGTSGDTDNAIIRANGDLGSNIQSSGIIIDDDNNITGASSITVAGPVNVTDADDGYQVNGTKVLGAQEGTITSITTPNFGDPDYDKNLSELTAFVYSMNDKTNEILVALRAHGIIAT